MDQMSSVAPCGVKSPEAWYTCARQPGHSGQHAQKRKDKTWAAWRDGQKQTRFVQVNPEREG